MFLSELVRWTSTGKLSGPVSCPKHGGMCKDVSANAEEPLLKFADAIQKVMYTEGVGVDELGEAPET